MAVLILFNCFMTSLSLSLSLFFWVVCSLCIAEMCFGIHPFLSEGDLWNIVKA